MSDSLQRYRVYVVLVLVVVTGAGGLFYLLKRPQPAPIILLTPVPSATPSPTPTPTPAPVRVYVTGAVQAPDVYLLLPGSIVKDAIAAAGGSTADADLDRINLAVQLADQQQVHVPRRGEGTLPVPPPAADAGSAEERPATPSAASPLNINTASTSELEALPGIGPAFAQRIVDYREQNGPFVTVEQLTEVKGIGPATLAKLEGLITTH